MVIAPSCKVVPGYLWKLELVLKDKRRYRARRNVIEAFIPPTWEAPQAPSLEELLAELPPTDDDDGPTLFDDHSG